MKPIFRLAIASLIATQIPFLSDQSSFAQSATSVASFQCKVVGSSYVTVAVSKNGTVSNPMIAWTTEEFSSAGFPPEQRCKDVTNRLNNVLSQNGGTLNSVYLTTGRVNRQTVLCAVNNTTSGCNENNLLFTLKQGNQPSKLLRNLSSATGSPIQESGGQDYVPLQQVIQGLFK
ncbi:COP23 domain-containing protein [Kamptonema formosum]|uniref:COP23 domain-containing protein n=1 Tax=Kamptonema formosum TaxID=331992 RepID=UPI000368354F|nr:COP23 domain-containing protein [Oscillatoria sp. PCC 10802]